MAEPIRKGDSGPAVTTFQKHLNDRLRARGVPRIAADGDCGDDTIEAAAYATWFLGGLLNTVKKVASGTITRGAMKMIAHPDRRPEVQLGRARERRGKPYPYAKTASVGPLKVITCSEWGAAAPRGAIVRVGRPPDIIFHHTAGHHPELDGANGASTREAAAYARAIQADHMGRGYVDSGHNFLITRTGLILEGRRGSYAAIADGVMVSSAHCPGKNGSPGIEHEHLHEPSMSAAQREASLNLHAFICRKTGIKPANVFPHKKFFGTECPAELLDDLPGFRADLTKRLG